MNADKKKLSGRDRILLAAQQLFIKNGYEATSPQAIYSECGLGQSSFYHHFKNKQALMEAVLISINESIQKELEEIEQQSDEPVTRIKQYLQQRQRGSKGCRLGRFMYETSAKNPDISKQLNHYLDSISNFLQRNIEQAQSQKSINQTISSILLANLIISQIQGAYLLSRTKSDDDFLQEQLTFLQQFVLKN